ncbi:MAG: hypothetical protein ABIS84_07285 [Arachnia sp.]
MNGARLRTWALSVLASAAAMLLLVLGAPTGAADPQPGPTSIRVTAALSPDFQVTASGLLTDRDGRAVGDAQVKASLNGTEVAGTSTSPDGTYQLFFTLPEDLRTGEQQLLVAFGGRDRLDASQATTVIPAAQAPAPEDPPSPAESPSPTPAPPVPALPGVTLEVSLSPTLVPLGGLVMVAGTLLGEDGTPIPDGRIALLVDGTESADSVVLTGPQGVFQTFADIPDDQPAGKAELVVTFAGNATHAPGQKAFPITVEELPLAESTPASASPTVSGTPEATATDGTVSSPVATADVKPSKAVDPNPLSWFYVALIVVGGTALLVAAGLVFRTMYAQRDSTRRGEGGLDELLEVDGDVDDDETVLFSVPFGDEEPVPVNQGIVDADGPTGPAMDSGPQAEPDDELHPRRSAD